MFREQGGKKFYNFGPTVNSNAKPKYSKIKSMSQASRIKRELERNFRSRSWKIKRK